MELILSEEEIEAENSRMIIESDTLVSLLAYPSVITGSALKSLIIGSTLPNDNIYKTILKNRNIRTTSEEIHVIKGITINSSTLKYLPTDTTFYSSHIVEDNIATQLSSLLPVLILHTSLDNEWYYIQSYYYRGWIKKNDVTILTDSQFREYINPDKFIIITDKNIHINDTYLDMGTKIPILAVHDDYYEALIPTKDGSLIANILTSVANLGYLPYTKENVLKQAYKYLYTKYSWGGTNGGIDCSLLIVNIFKTFGLLFPRDTKDQGHIIGARSIPLKGLTEEEKKEILDTLPTPYILFKKGHVLLGIEKDTVLHAYGDASRVLISRIDDSYGTNLYPLLTSVSILYK
jgi:hypothetical protein